MSDHVMWLLLNMFAGGYAMLALIFVLFMLIYLRRERLRRGLSLRVYFEFYLLPPSIMLATAIFVSNLGGVLVAGGFWIQDWPRVDALHVRLHVIVAGAFLMMVGALYRIAAITQPTYGHLPWLLSFGLLLVFCLAEVFLFMG